ncbi:MAG: response regulator [Dysosmobacter welbionis]
MYRVVIVEDDPMVSLLNRTFVERDARFQVVQSFQDGRAALAWLEQNPADLAVLDVYMPLFTGLELLHALRGQGVGIDAIMVTAANDAPTVDTLLKLGVVDYLVKPFTYERFQQALDNFCRHRDAVAGDAVEQRAGPALSPPSGGAPAAQGPPGEHPELVRACLRVPPQGLPSEALSRQTGLSVVTVRRYVNYLVERGGGQRRQLRHRRPSLPPVPLPRPACLNPSRQWRAHL